MDANILVECLLGVAVAIGGGAFRYIVKISGAISELSANVSGMRGWMRIIDCDLKDVKERITRLEVKNENEKNS